MIALLGLLAVAGYQNRDRLGQLLSRATGSDATTGTAPSAGGTPTEPSGGGFFDNLGNIFGGSRQDAPASQGGSFFDSIGDGLRDLVDRFRGNGHEDEAKSWIETGPNRQISETALAEALGDDTITELSRETGLSRPELLDRLKTVLPAAVDTLTPEGRLPPATPYTGSPV
ncbi:MAG: DUF937 domain-containing protein [Bauldia sp.]|nr:DUF937 domain-containing protein [Bauldia sp.]